MLSPKTKLCFYIAVFSVVQICLGQIPTYYNDVNLSLTGTALRDELATKIINTHIRNLSYSNVWEACRATDVDPNDATKVLLIYGYDDSDSDITNDRTRGINNNGGSVGQWNREHTYPKSLGIPNLGESGPGADAHALRPCDVQRNSSRNNKKFITGSGNSGAVSIGWYPGDEWKGDIARMMMYMYLRYGSQCLPSNVAIGTTNSVDSNMINLLLEWNAEDPVSEVETQRNTYHEDTNNTYSQGNRNPFIDNPALATQIWGGPQAQDLFTSGPEINLLGNGNNINDGATTTSTTNDTDFGSTDTLSGSITKVFTIQNVGTQTLTIGNPTISGSDAGEFSITAPSMLSIDSGSSVTFTVEFDPTSDGVKNNAQIVITSNDANEATYNFAIRGEGTSGSGSTCGTDLFISEYMEGSSSNKFLEIFNPTNGPIDLSDYDIVRYANGGSSVNGSFTLSGTLASNDVIVIEDSLESISGFEGDLSTNSAAMDFNGDDAVALRKNGTIIDVIGQIGFDPGSEWSGCTYGTANSVMRRKPSITSGDPDGSDAFDPSVEWDCVASDNVSDLGSHTVACSSPEISVEGNSIVIANGDTTPSVNDDTDFGGATTDIGSVTKTFTIKNEGLANLTIDAINISGDFSVIDQPSSPIAPGGSATLSITFSPTANGNRNATVSIESNDGTNDPYEFDITGEGIDPPSSGDSETIVIQNFDGTPTEWNFTTDIAFFDNGSDDFYGIHNSNSNPNDGTPTDTGVGNTTQINYSGISGDFFFVNDLEDTDDGGSNGTAGDATITFNSIDITTYSDVVFSFDYDIFGFDTSDYIEYELIYDGISQGKIPIISTPATNTSQEGNITVNIPNNVALLELKIITNQNGASDQAAIDNIKLTGIASSDNAIQCASSASFSDLIISEVYDEPSGSLGYIEIYNGTNNTIDLTEYQINRFTSTSDTVPETYEFPTSSEITPGQVLVGKTSSVAGDSNVYDFTFTGNNGGFNADDIFRLVKTSSPSTIIDEWQESEFGSNGFNYRRNTDITGPNSSYQNSDWTYYNGVSLTTANLGTYNYSASSSETTWDGTAWSNGAPTQTTKAIIAGNYDMNSQNSIETCECEINSGATLTVVDGKYINVQNDIINQGNIIVENNGSLSQVGNNAIVSGIGNYTLKRQTTQLANNYAYTYWSSPVKIAPLSNITTSSKYYYAYNSSTQWWETAENTTVMTPGNGYITNGPENGTYPLIHEAVFTGSPFNSGNVTFQGTYKGLNSDGQLTTDDDFGIAGNPYPSAIDGEKLIQENENLGGTLYFWTHNTENVVGDEQTQDDFVYWNSVGAVPYTPNCSGCTSPNQYIASGQSFSFFTVTKPSEDANTDANFTLNFNNSQRVTTNNDNFYRSQEKDRIWLNLQGEKNSSQNLFGFLPDATDGLDRLYDGKTIESGDAILYSILNINDTEHYLAIQGKPALENNEEQIIPLGIFVGSAQEVSLYIGTTEGKLNDVTVFLEDIKLNTIHNLKESAYKVNLTEAGNHHGRFNLLINSNRSLAIEDINNENPLVIIDTKNVLEVKNSKNVNIKNVVVYDILGKELVNVKTQSTTVKIASKQLKKHSILIVKTVLENGQTFSDKLLKK